VLVAVNASKNPLRINVGFLIHQPVGSSREIHFEFPNIRLQPDFDVRDLNGTVKLGRTPQGILVQAVFTAFTTAECVRCLTELDQPLQTEFSELFAFTPNSVTDSGLILPEDGNINLEPILREYLLVEIPISPLCKDDCKGLCTICGEDLNVFLCEHQQRVHSE
jgi:uncharacterized protein